MPGSDAFDTGFAVFLRIGIVALAVAAGVGVAIVWQGGPLLGCSVGLGVLCGLWLALWWKEADADKEHPLRPTVPLLTGSGLGVGLVGAITAGPLGGAVSVVLAIVVGLPLGLAAGAAVWLVVKTMLASVERATSWLGRTRVARRVDRAVDRFVDAHVPGGCTPTVQGHLTPALVGSPAVVRDPIPGGGYGRVSIAVAGGWYSCAAYAPQPIPRAQMVTVVSLLGPDTVQVRPG